MKSLLATLLITFISFSFAQAQSQSLPQAPSSKVKYSVADPEAKAKAQAEKLKEQLNLTDEQYQKVLEINLMAAQQNTFSGTPEENQALIKKIQVEKKKAIGQVLSDSQLSLYKKLYPDPVEAPATQTGNVNTISIQPAGSSTKP
jgi:Spy/CpxP family protein refolding chaperone